MTKWYMSKISTIKGSGIVLKDDNIDTDRIIPARYLRCVIFDKLGANVFEDDRVAATNQGQTHPFDWSRYQGAGILITGTNFGSGSSREHAVHALTSWGQGLCQSGIRAIIARGRYSEIFFGNALANGLPCFIIGQKDWEDLVKMIEHDPSLELEISLEKMTVLVNSKFIELQFQHTEARDALLDGSWDSLSTLLENKGEVEERIQGLVYLSK